MTLFHSCQIYVSLSIVLTKLNFKTLSKEYERCHGNQFRQFWLSIEIHNIVIFFVVLLHIKGNIM